MSACVSSHCASTYSSTVRISHHLELTYFLSLQHPSFGYTLQPEEAWTAVARWLQQRHGLFQLAEAPLVSNPEPEAIALARAKARVQFAVNPFVFTACVVTAVCNMITAFTVPGDAVMAFTPLYRPLLELVGGCGRRLVTVRLQKQQQEEEQQYTYTLDMDLMERRIVEEGVKFMIFCNPHNPSGKVWSAQEVSEVVRVCHKHNVFLLSDEVWW